MNYLNTKTYRPTSLMTDMDRAFNQIFETAKAPANRGFAVDIAETDEAYRIKANLPGFGAGDVDVQVDENLLVIEAKDMENTENKENDKKLSWHVHERRNGNLKRSFVLPEDVKKDAVEAEMKNGVLSVILNKKAAVKPFAVKVQDK